jgi:hypothetical protein
VVAVFTGCVTPKFTSVCKGLIWLLVATAAEVPFTVRLAILLRPLFCLWVFYRTGVIVFGSEWFVFHSVLSIKGGC